MKRKRIIFENNCGFKLVGVLHIPENASVPFPAVVFCHGFGTNKDTGGKPVYSDTLAKNGIMALRFDFTGSGESDRIEESATITQRIDDLKRAISYVCTLPEVDKNRIAVVGHSLGAVVTIVTATLDPRIKTFVSMSAPSSTLKLYLSKSFPSVIRKISKILKRFNCRLLWEVKKFQTKKYIGKVKYPFLIIHGDKDKLVPVNQAYQLVKLNENASSKIISDTNHDFTDQHSITQVSKILLEWFKNNL